MSKIPVLTIVGPTASGKTSLAVALAKEYNGEIVSADSMQIYKGMDIATAKPTQQEMGGVPHHMLSFVEPNRRFSVADYVVMAKECINDIHNRGKMPVLAGGTGQYISSILENLTFTETKFDPDFREKLKKRAQTYGPRELLEELSKVDPETASSLHPNDLGRIIRALEIYYLDGITMTQQREMSRRLPSPYNACIIGLNSGDRSYLYERINARVDVMVESGILAEAEGFLKLHYASTAKQAIGYKELAPFIKGEVSLEDALSKLKMETRRYAKRQLTWFRKMQGIKWLYIDEYKEFIDLQHAAHILVNEWLGGGRAEDEQVF